MGSRRIFYPRDEKGALIAALERSKRGGKGLMALRKRAAEAALALGARSRPLPSLFILFLPLLFYLLLLPPLLRALFSVLHALPFLLSTKKTKQKNSTEIVLNWGIPALQSPPAEKLGPVKAAVGDTVVFKWGGGLSYALYQVSKRE